MTGCATLCSNHPAGLSHIPKRAPGNRGDGARIGHDEANNTLLLACHAAFRVAAPDPRKPFISCVSWNIGDLLSKCNNRLPVKPKKAPARALFSLVRVVQSIHTPGVRPDAKSTSRLSPDFNSGGNMRKARRDCRRTLTQGAISCLEFASPLHY
jgi:hypothetical protein